jgi:N-acetylglucosamine-6-phosphate deacetylase
MMNTIMARRLIDAGQTVEYPLVTVEDGRISKIEALGASDQRRGAATYCFPEATLAPSYVDIHMHGCAGHDVMEASPAALNAIGTYLATRGVGAYLATTVTSGRDEMLRSLAGIGAEIHRLERAARVVGAVPIGIHLEGPFLSHRKRGVHTDSLLEAPSIALFERFWEASEGQIRLMTIAPELPGALELIAHATERGVRCSMGHSDATLGEAEAGFVAGARSATHTFNAMRALDHRDPGLIAYVLDQPELFAEIICDGIHVDPVMVRLYFRAKGKDRSVLITDCMSATGMPEGMYILGNMEVEVRDGRCTSGGRLAGSVLTLDRAVQNFMEFTGADLNTAMAAASRNPSQLMGIADSWGTLAVGRAANMVALSPTAQVMQNFLAGQPTIG